MQADTRNALTSRHQDQLPQSVGAKFSTSLKVVQNLVGSLLKASHLWFNIPDLFAFSISH